MEYDKHKPIGTTGAGNVAKVVGGVPASSIGKRNLQKEVNN